ncbi:MAG TPA: hypothetical protein VN257_03280, partial [Actinotalea sp.]|nr:hypothetical protein [Actinotalea sp.]
MLTMTTTAAPTLVTLADVAALAHVQRPVVSVWRTRAAGSDAPFPPVALRHGRQELFPLADVVSWLELTGRGNNPEARQDASLVAALDALPEADLPTAVDGLLALLALKTVLGTAPSGLDPQDVLDLADDVDPHDLCLHRELSALGGDVVPWAEHADAVAAAAYTPAAAVAALLAQHRRLGLAAVSATVLADAATGLVARLVTDLCDEPGDNEAADAVPRDDEPRGALRGRALEARSGSARAPLVDPTGSGDLLPAIAALRDEPGVVQIPTLTSADARRARRLLLAAGWDVREAALDDGLVQPPAGATVVAHFPSPTRPAMTDAQVVEAVAGIAATLPVDAHAVVLGPASALTNRLPAGLQSARATTLRSGRVRAVVRLPAGLWPAQSRRELAVWVLGPGPSDVRREDHRTALADMTVVPLDAATVEDLLTDLVAALGPGDALRAHAFRFVQLAVTQSVIA